MVREAELALGLAVEPVLVRVVQVDVEGLEAPEHAEPDAAGAERAHRHPLQVVGALHAVGDVPAALRHPLVGRDVVAHQGEDHHDDVLGDADAVGVGDLGDGDAVLHRRLQVDVVGADAGGDRQLQVRGAGDPLGGEVGRPERLRDDDVGVGELALEDRAGAVLVRGHDQRVTLAFEVVPQPQLTGDAAEQRPGREAESLRGGEGLPVGIALEHGQVGTRVRVRIPAHGVGIQDAEDLGHCRTSWWRWSCCSRRTCGSGALTVGIRGSAA